MVRILLPPAASQANSDWPVVLREDKPGELLYLDARGGCPAGLVLVLNKVTRRRRSFARWASAASVHG